MIDTNLFYHRFKLVAQTNFFQNYLGNAYNAIDTDLEQLKQKPGFNRNKFCCLLSGVSGEITAQKFISFTLRKNPKAKITIVDLGKEQTKAVKKLVSDQYSNNVIDIIQGDLLKLSFPQNSFDWIETDVIMAYFSDKGLIKLLDNWKQWLKPDGFISLRESAPNNTLEFIIDRLKVIVARIFFGGVVTSRSRTFLENTFSQAGFRFTSHSTEVPTLRRYCLIKS